MGRVKSQADRILAVLKEGGTITPMDALTRFGCFRLAARILELREAGYKIRNSPIKRGGRYFACYHIGNLPERCE